MVVYLFRLNFVMIHYGILHIRLSCWLLVVGFREKASLMRVFTNNK